MWLGFLLALPLFSVFVFSDMCFLLVEVSAAPCGLSGNAPKAAAGREALARSGQAENWGRPSGGTDFLLACPGGGFSVPERKAGGGLSRSGQGESGGSMSRKRHCQKESRERWLESTEKRKD